MVSEQGQMPAGGVESDGLPGPAADCLEQAEGALVLLERLGMTALPFEQKRHIQIGAGFACPVADLPEQVECLLKMHCGGSVLAAQQASESDLIACPCLGGRFSQ